MKKVIPFVLLSCMFLSSSAGAIVFGPTNFDLFGYPDHHCYEPYKPYNPDQFAWQRFVNEVEEYRICINNYVEAAENDIQRIIEAADDAVDEYNNYVQWL